MSIDAVTRLPVHAETLTWQSRIRIGVACIAAASALLLLAGPAPSESARLISFAAGPFVLLATSLYVAAATLVLSAAMRERHVSRWVVNGMVGTDVAYIFALTAAVSAPQDIERALILAFLVLHFTTLYFGRHHGASVLALTAIGYAALVQLGRMRGAELSWGEELWSLGAFLLVGSVVLLDRDRVRGQLASMVLTDPLTGCVNRRGFDQSLAREVSRATRSGSELALLAVDVDHFKAVNDTFGHLAGDAVLRDVGMLMSHAARAGDVVARTGGEEFCLILPDTSVIGAHHVASRLCASLRAHRFGGDGPPIHLTVSIGVSTADAGARSSLRDCAEVLKGRADEALYAAKRAGRDRVRVWAQKDEQVEMTVLI